MNYSDCLWWWSIFTDNKRFATLMDRFISTKSDAVRLSQEPLSSSGYPGGNQCFCFYVLCSLHLCAIQKTLFYKYTPYHSLSGFSNVLCSCIANGLTTESQNILRRNDNKSFFLIEYHRMCLIQSYLGWQGDHLIVSGLLRFFSQLVFGYLSMYDGDMSSVLRIF